MREFDGKSVARLGSGLEVQLISSKMKIGFFLIVSHFLLIAFGARPDEDHPRIHFPKRADTSHEGNCVTSYLVDQLFDNFVISLCFRLNNKSIDSFSTWFFVIIAINIVISMYLFNLYRGKHI